jgi:hypothetical protein
MNTAIAYADPETAASVSPLMSILSKELASQAEAVDRLCELLSPGQMNPDELSRRMQRMDYVHQVLLDISNFLAGIGGSLGSVPEEDLRNAFGKVRLAELRNKLVGETDLAASGQDEGLCDFF